MNSIIYRCRALRRDRRGTSAVEFALVLPILFTVLFGIIKFGTAFNQSLAMTDGVRAAARQLAIGRFNAGTAYADTVARFKGSAPQLGAANVTLTMTINGQPCSDQKTCQDDLNAPTAQGAPAVLKASMPCKLVIMGRDLAPNCHFSSQTTERVE